MVGGGFCSPSGLSSHIGCQQYKHCRVTVRPFIWFQVYLYVLCSLFAHFLSFLQNLKQAVLPPRIRVVVTVGLLSWKEQGKKETRKGTFSKRYCVSIMSTIVKSLQNLDFLVSTHVTVTVGLLWYAAREIKKSMGLYTLLDNFNKCSNCITHMFYHTDLETNSLNDPQRTLPTRSKLCPIW